MPKTFLAAVLEEQNKPLALRKLELPEHLYVGQVLVKIEYSGVCGSQLNEISGVKGPDKYLPHCLGHEGSGTVIATGPGVRNVRLNDKVVVHWRKGNGIDAIPPKYWCPELGKEIGGGWNTTFQEFSVVSENRLTKIDKDIPLDVAALMGCAVTTGFGVVTHEAKVKIGESVAVFGAGGVGMTVIHACKLAGAYPIRVMDRAFATEDGENKRHLAAELGADWTYGGIDTGMYSTPPDVIIDTTGHPEVMQAAWKQVRPGGRVCLVAQLRHDQTFPLQTLPMHQGQELFGSDGGGTNPSIDIPRILNLYKADRAKLRKLISNWYSLPQINIAINHIKDGILGRALIEMY